MKRLLAALILSVSFPTLAWATQILPMTADDLAKNADLVFVGTCLSRTAPAGTPPHTEYIFKIENAIKGGLEKAATVTLRQWGGTSDATTRVPRLLGMPDYVPGQSYMLYLGAETSAGLRAPVGLGQGVFKVMKRADGTVVVENEWGNRFLFPASGEAPVPTKGKAVGPVRSADHLRLNDLIQSVRKTEGAS